MLRMMLAVFAWPVAVAVLASAILWYRAEFPERPGDHLLDPVQVRSARHTANLALERFRSMPAGEQQRVTTALRAVMQRPDAWVAELDAADPRILCLGEQHEPSTRRFLAERFFPHYPVDRLLIEATPAQHARIRQWLENGRDYVPLLDADIGAVLRAVRARNPGVVVRGIEETPEQARARIGGEGSRDRSLVRNFWRAWQPGRRSVILYGALHCADEGTWLYHLLREQLPPREDVRTTSVRILGTGQHEPTRAFVFFLQALGLGDGDFAIRDTDRVPAHLARWFPFFHQDVLSRYDSVIVFHNTPAEMASSARGRARDEPVSNAPGSGDPLPQWVSGS